MKPSWAIALVSAGVTSAARAVASASTVANVAAMKVRLWVAFIGAVSSGLIRLGDFIFLGAFIDADPSAILLRPLRRVYGTLGQSWFRIVNSGPLADVFYVC